MTNGEKYKTAQERMDAFSLWCNQRGQECHTKKGYGAITCAKCQFAWLDLECEEEEPLPCPFCGRKDNFDICVSNSNGALMGCICGYSTPKYPDYSSMVSAHNRVAKKCMESEAK